MRGGLSGAVGQPRGDPRCFSVAVTLLRRRWQALAEGRGRPHLQLLEVVGLHAQPAVAARIGHPLRVQRLDDDALLLKRLHLCASGGKHEQAWGPSSQECHEPCRGPGGLAPWPSGRGPVGGGLWRQLPPVSAHPAGEEGFACKHVQMREMRKWSQVGTPHPTQTALENLAWSNMDLMSSRVEPVREQSVPRKLVTSGSSAFTRPLIAPRPRGTAAGGLPPAGSGHAPQGLATGRRCACCLPAHLGCPCLG